MAPTTTVLRLLGLAAALGPTTATFSLDTSGPSWDYTTKDLADSTSQACKDAYSASIDCDETLLKIVASMDPDFDPQPSDLESMCTTTCSDSLYKYVKNVKAACGKNGNLAGVSNGDKEVYEAPVETVGEIFQYEYSQGCAKNGTDYCYLTFPMSENWASTEFPCSDKCAVQYYKNAHEQPGSGYYFNYFSLVTQTSWWNETFAGGWKTAAKCGEGK
ncbi:hypothetical protein N7450_003984 [Penicillium hetheringtonii]|uniref:Uncharacterized protein n=1 Tax=Penicillium hetheringtonii TaxID=911720 RepID=A0AAD6GUP3_9EURO|nr:hypothetical protein N7450_003984 [Penicillium hetheringtonii]